MSKWETFEYIFSLFCLFTTSVIVGYWAYKFSKNDDLSTVEYKQYNMNHINHVSKSPYLSHTICFRTPFLSSKKTHRNTSEKRQTERYLSGTEYLEFNYNSFALNLTDYVKSYYFRWRNGTRQFFNASTLPWQIVDHSFNGFWVGRFYRCFTMKSPNSNSEVISLLIENQVHHQGMFISKQIFYFRNSCH